MAVIIAAVPPNLVIHRQVDFVQQNQVNQPIVDSHIFLFHSNPLTPMKTAEDILNEKARDIISVAADTTIGETLMVMTHHRIGAILVRQADQIMGIWTERDLMYNTLQTDFDVATSKIGDYMITKLVSVDCSETCYELMDKFLGMRLRHLLITKNGQYIGMLSAGDVMKSTLQEKNREFEELNFEVSWDYYENWRSPRNQTEINEIYLPYPANVQASRGR